MLFILLLMLCNSMSLCMHNKVMFTKYSIEAVPCGLSQMQGARNYMEDTYSWEVQYPRIQYHGIQYRSALFGLYDGHGGSYVADEAAKNIKTYIDLEKCNNNDEAKFQLIKAFYGTQISLGKEAQTQGSTALVAIRTKEALHVANVGDSRAVLCSNGLAVPLSVDHTAENPAERDRIEKIIQEKQSTDIKTRHGLLYVLRYKAKENESRKWVRCTRALGDKDAAPHVIATPEIQHRKLMPEDDFLILATDGLWDVLSNQKAVDLVKAELKKDELTHKDFALAAELLRNAAYILGSTDNISVMVIGLKDLKAIS